MKIITDNLKTSTPVLHTLSGRTPTPMSFVQLDCRFGAELSAGPDRPGEVPAIVKIRLAVRWAIPAQVTGDSLRRLLASPKFTGLCNRILAGFTVSGNAQTLEGHYSLDAELAIREAEDVIDSIIELDKSR